MTKKIFENKEQLEDNLKVVVINQIKKVLSTKKSATILFSGGSTPIGLFNKLAETKFNWENVKVGLVDDRMVDYKDEFSNARLLKTEFLDRIKGTRPIFLPLVLNPEKIEENMDEATNCAQTLGVADLVLLGMGNDGHFASLFPNDKNSTLGLSTEYTQPLIYTTAPDHPTNRISHTWTHLKQSEKIIVFATGKSKLDIIENSATRLPLPIDTLLEEKNIKTSLFWAP